MFYIAIKHDDIKDSKSLVNILVFKLLPICDLIFDIGSLLKVIEVHFNIPLLSLPPILFTYHGDDIIRITYHSMKTKEYYAYTNTQYKTYCSLLESGRRDLHEDIRNVIQKVRRIKDPEEVLTFNDVFAIKRMGTIYGYNEEVSTILKGLSNGKDFERSNHTSYAWSARTGKWRTVVEELEAVNNNQIKIRDAIRIKEKLKIENVLN